MCEAARWTKDGILSVRDGGQGHGKGGEAAGGGRETGQRDEGNVERAYTEIVDTAIVHIGLCICRMEAEGMAGVEKQREEAERLGREMKATRRELIQR